MTEEIKKIEDNCKIKSKEQFYEPIKPPAGTIFVGTDVNNGWISDKHAFYGWNIQFCKSVTSDEIKFK